MDCGPTTSSFTICALAAANELLIPIQTEFLALNQLAAIMSTVHDVRKRLNPDLEIFGFLLTMFDGRTRHSMDVLEQIAAEASRYRVRAFKPIPKTVRVAEAAAAGQAVCRYAPGSAASAAYDDLAALIDGDAFDWRERERTDTLFERVGSFVVATAYAAAPCG